MTLLCTSHIVVNIVTLIFSITTQCLCCCYGSHCGAAKLIYRTLIECSAPSGCTLVIYCTVYRSHGGHHFDLVNPSLGCTLRVYPIIHCKIRAPQCTHKYVLVLVPDWLQISRDNTGCSLYIIAQMGRKMALIMTYVSIGHNHLEQPQPLDHNHITT